MNKGVLYANGVVSSLSQSLLSKDFLNRLCKCKNKDEFLTAFSETQFSFEEEDISLNEKMDFELANVIEFVKKESPDDTFTQFFLLPFDYYNILSFCKCKILNLDASKYFGPEGNFSFEQIKNNVENKKYNEFGNEFIKKALLDCERLEKADGFEGWEIEYAFKKKMYANLLKISLKNNLLHELAKDVVTVENISVAMRAKTQFEFESQFVTLGYLSKEQLLKIFKKDKSVLQGINNKLLEKFVSVALNDNLKKSCVEFEKNRQDLFVKFFYKHIDNIESIAPFAYYVYKKISDIKNVRMIYSYIENGLQTEIEKRILNCER